MKNQEKRKRLTTITCAGIAVGVIIIVAVFAALWFFTPFGKPAPTVQIVQPADNLSIKSGDGVQLWVSGESRNGFKSFYLSADDQLVEFQQMSDPRERNPVIRFTWTSSHPGIHKISVIGVNNSDRASQPDNIFVAVSQQSLFHLPPESPEQDSQEAAEGPQEDLSEDSGPNSPESGADDSSGAESSIGEGEDVVGGENEVDQALIDQFLVDVDLDGDFPINLPGQPEDEIPIISLFNVQETSDGEGFNVAYQIQASDDIGLSMMLLEVVSLDQPDQVDNESFSCLGETICRQDGNLQLAQGSWLISTQALDISGQSSEMHIAQIQTLEGNDPPAIAMGEFSGDFNLGPQQEEAEVVELIDEVYDIGQPGLSSYGCSGQIVNLEIPYVYYGDNADDVYLGATAKKENLVVAAGHTRIQRGVGIGIIEMETLAPDILDQSDELELYFRIGADHFYQETADIQISWPIPEPDLTITYVAQEGNLLHALIKNIGCTSVQGFELRFKMPNGEIVDIFNDRYLAQGISYSLENLVVNPNLFSMGFEAIVDPNDLIQEIDEDNNTFTLAPISVKHVHIKSIDILTVPENSGRGNKGEFRFYAKVNRSEEVWRPEDSDGYYSLGAGLFELDTIVVDLISGQFYTEPFIVAYPVNWNENLHFLFDAWEEDGVLVSDTEYFPVMMDLSSDYLNDNCWKRGGEFSATASKGEIDYYTVYFDVVLNER